MNKKKQRFAIYILVVSLLISACGPGQSLEPALTPTPSLTPAPTSMPTPFPVNEKIMGEATTLTAANANFIEHVADLWTSHQPIAGAVFYNDTTLALAAGDKIKSFNNGPAGVGTVTLTGKKSGVTLWDLRTNTSREVLSSGDPHNGYSAVLVSPNDKWLALAASDHVLLGELQDSATGELTFKPTEIDISEIEAKSPVIGATFSNDSRFLAIRGQNGGIMLWDVESNRKAAAQPVVVVDKEHSLNECELSSLGAAFTPDGKSLLATCYQQIRIWDLNLKDYSAFPGTSSVTVFALSPDSTLLATGDYFGEVSIWTYPSGELQAKLSGHANRVESLAFSPDGSLLASSSDGIVIVADLKRGVNLTTLETPVSFVSFSPDGKFLLTGTYALGGALWGIRPGSLTAKRSGVKVVLSAGATPLEGWKAVVPDSWLSPSGTFPRHEVRIVSAWVQKNSCNYGGENGSLLRFLTTRQATVSVEIADMDTNSIVAKKVFEGELPPDCPEHYVFSQNSVSAFSDGAAPEIGPFEPWLKEAMQQLGYE